MHLYNRNRAKTHCQSSNHQKQNPKNGYKTQQQFVFRGVYKNVKKQVLFNVFHYRMTQFFGFHNPCRSPLTSVILALSIATSVPSPSLFLSLEPMLASFIHHPPWQQFSLLLAIFEFL
jgi:hypothetical protein